MKQAQGYKQLTAIQNDAIKAQADVATEPIQSLAKVHVHTFVNQTEVLVVIEAIEEAYAVFLVVWIALIQAIDNVALSQT